MGFHDVALICENGHVINSSYTTYPQYNSLFCNECGAKAINKCPGCSSPIRGTYHDEDFFGYGGFNAPAYCGNCGKPYPWTEEKLKALQEIISLSDLAEEDKEDFNRNLPDILSETPRTNVAALKLKIIGAKVGKEIWEVAKEIIVEIASETAKKSMGL